MSDSDSLESYERPPLPAIHDAVQNLDVDGVRRELAAGANVDVLDEEGYTPLYYACKATSIAKAIREEKVLSALIFGAPRIVGSQQNVSIHSSQNSAKEA